MMTGLRLIEMRVWLVLVALTIGSFGYGVSVTQPDGSREEHVAFAVVIFAALAKAWLVINYFMELRYAPGAIRRVADGWMLFTGFVIFCVHFFL